MDPPHFKTENVYVMWRKVDFMWRNVDVMKECVCNVDVLWSIVDVL